MRLLVLPKLYCLLTKHLNEWNRRQYFSRWSPCFGFFACPCYSKRIHYQTLERQGTQNIAGAKYVGNKMPRRFQNFSVCLGNRSVKKLPNTQQKPLYILLVMASAYLGILPRAMTWFFNSWDNLFCLNYIVYLQNTWTSETEDNVSPADHLVLIFSRVLVIAREYIIAAFENQGKQRGLSKLWKSIITLFLKRKKKTGDDEKNSKRLTWIQVLPKYFTSYKIRYNSLRKRK